MAISDGDFSQIQTNISPDFGHAVVTDLTISETYRFKVQAVNDFGFSEDSNEISLICAHIPETPLAPTTTVVGNQVIIDWVAPSD